MGTLNSGHNTMRSCAKCLLYKFSFYLPHTLGGSYNLQHSSISQMRDLGQGTHPGLGPAPQLRLDTSTLAWLNHLFLLLEDQHFKGDFRARTQWNGSPVVIFLAAKLVGGYYPMPTCQEELNLFDNSIVPFGFAQMAPVVEVSRAYNLISSACKQSLSLQGGMMMGFSEPCSFTFYRAMHTVTIFCGEGERESNLLLPPQAAYIEEASVWVRRNGRGNYWGWKGVKLHTGFLRDSSVSPLWELSSSLAG